MLQLGQIQQLTIVKEVEFGVYLATSAETAEERVLLPAKYLPKEKRLGDTISAFLYKDSKDRLIATTKEPVMTLHQVGVCKVEQTGKIGAFLNWGLEKDLLLPFKEQTYPVKQGDQILVALYIDKSERLCATMKVYPYLSKESGYQKDDQVQGTVYELSDNFGAFVAVDDKYSALVPKKDLQERLHVGQKIEARVVAVKADGKLDLSLKQKAYLQMQKDADRIKEALIANGGVLDFTDKASPELIRERMQMSKNEFKRAVGHLYKEREIEIKQDSIIIKK